MSKLIYTPDWPNGTRVVCKGCSPYFRKGEVCTVETNDASNYYFYKGEGGLIKCEHNDKFELLEESNKKSKIMSTITNIYRSLKLGEPLKTFVETGIKNKDNTLTAEGTQLLMEILAEKHEAELKEAADKIKAEQEKE